MIEEAPRVATRRVGPRLDATLGRWLQVGISFVCLGWFGLQLRGLDWSLGESLRDASWTSIAACFAGTSLLYSLRLLRLRFWTERAAQRALTWREWGDLYLASIALGSLSPARLGDFSRIALLAKTGLSLRVRGQIVLLDKLSDFLYVPLALCVAAPILSRQLGVSPWLPAAGALPLLLGYLLAARILGGPLGAQALASGAALSLLGFPLFIVSNALLFWGLGIRLPLADVTAIIVTVGVLANLPLSIAGIGVREASLFAILESRGVASSHATALVLFEFLLNVLWPLLLYAAWKALRRMERSTAHAAG